MWKSDGHRAFRSAQPYPETIPPHMVACVEFIRSKAIDVCGIFRVPAAMTIVFEKKKEITETGDVSKLNEVEDPHVVSNLFLLYMRLLPSSPLPFDEVIEMGECGELEDFDAICELLVSSVSSPKWTTLKFVLPFLGEVAANSARNEMSPSDLATVIGPALCRPKTGSYMSVRHIKGLSYLTTLTYVLIENHVNLIERVDELRKAKFAEKEDNGTVVVDENAFPGNGLPSNSSLNSSREDKMSILVDAKRERQSGNNNNSNNNNNSRISSVIQDSSMQQQQHHQQGTVDSAQSTNFSSSSKRGSDGDLMKALRSVISSSVSVIFNPSSIPQKNTGTNEKAWEEDNELKEMAAAITAGSDKRRMERKEMVRLCRELRSEMKTIEAEYIEAHGMRPTGVARDPIRRKAEMYRALRGQVREGAAVLLQAVARGRTTRRRISSESFDRMSMDEAEDNCVATNSSSSVEKGSVTTSSKQRNAKEDMKVKRQDSSSITASGARQLFQMSLTDLIEEKKKVKRQLRSFDADFQANHGRKPTKEEKEPIRSKYELYNDLKLLISGLEGASPNDESAIRLGLEKRILQRKLRRFEQTFEGLHGRRVKYHKDIAPVEYEYQRYKELKMIQCVPSPNG